MLRVKIFNLDEFKSIELHEKRAVETWDLEDGGQ
jgi:hypothetical protein